MCRIMSACAWRSRSRLGHRVAQTIGEAKRYGSTDEHEHDARGGQRKLFLNFDAISVALVLRLLDAHLRVVQLGDVRVGDRRGISERGVRSRVGVRHRRASTRRWYDG